MIASLAALQELLLSDPGEPHAFHADPFMARVQNALRAHYQSSDTVGSSDLAALLRQGILRSHVAQGHIRELRVPAAANWPDAQAWKAFGCDARRAGAGHFLVRAESWQPDWLDAGASVAVNDAIQEVPRRSRRLVPADPRVTEFTGHRTYFSAGQREAVRAAFLMPAGSTVVVNLPTGAGKTLAFQLPALVAAAEGGLTVVVVPTVALALDQEERFRNLLRDHEQGRRWSGLPLAYHGGLDPESKNGIRDGIRNGSLPIVFVSAEAAVGALRGPLFEAARQGRLRTFAIDEAHVVSQWGQSFRPQFQSIVGLREALLAECPEGARFRTLLLSATLTTESFETLRELFGQEGCQLVSELELRPEPAFMLHSASSEAERTECVLDAIRHLPRPLVLYTTLRTDAQHWYTRLREAGFRRIGLVRGGDMGDTTGTDVLRDWRGRALDLIVATSAFGLGMDQADVRSVVHACLPESIDRYYQEVGRAGRDGNAAAALLVSTPADLRVADKIAEEMIISVDRALERWDAMWVRRRSGGAGSYLLSLDDRPPDIPDSGERNASWNLRTLVLMARAGLIRFAAHAPPFTERRQGEDDASLESRRLGEMDRYSREVAVAVRDPRHSDKSHWATVVAGTRTALRTADEAALRLVHELRQLNRPLGDLFSDAYTLRDPAVRPPRSTVSCPVTRRNEKMDMVGGDPEVIPILKTAGAISSGLERALSPCTDSSARSWVASEPRPTDAREARRWRDKAMNLLRHAVSGGIVELCVSADLLSDDDWARLAAHAPLRFLIRTPFDRDRETDAFAQEVRVPRLTLLAGVDATDEIVGRILRVHRPHHVIVLPRGVTDPDRSYRRLFDIVRHVSLEDLLSRLET